MGSLPVPPVHFLGHLGCRRHDAGQPPGGPKEFSSSVLELFKLFLVDDLRKQVQAIHRAGCFVIAGCHL